METTVEAGEAGAEVPTRYFKSWNEYVGPVTTLRVGAGFLTDLGGYAQDEDAERQFHAPDKIGFRDFRFLIKGKLNLERQVTWSTGIMYDGPTHSWLFRETGIMVAVPEIWSHFFIGRTKEGFSLNKVMVGYAGWTMERAAISDATVPILADGVKWLGATPGNRLIWNLGFYGDALSEGQTFSTYDNQVALRVAVLPIIPETEGGTLLHVGVNARYGRVDNGRLQMRSRPESFTAPYFVDTGKFPAHHTRMLGGEAYYRPGSWLFGTEYWFVDVASPQTGDPVVHGGDLVATWLVTGETRAYNAVGGFFKQVIPANPVGKGGHGAVELVLRQSYIDLDGGTLRGGKFYRLTPMVNWYASERLRLEAAYGYGVLDRFSLVGGTHFFQFRAQIWI